MSYKPWLKHCVVVFLQEYPEDEILVVYDPDFKFGQNFFIALTPDGKDALINVSRTGTQLYFCSFIAGILSYKTCKK